MQIRDLIMMRSEYLSDINKVCGKDVDDENEDEDEGFDGELGFRHG
jgi:hypothetical protein